MMRCYSDWESQVTSALQTIMSSARDSVREAACPHHNIWQEPDSISYR